MLTSDTITKIMPAFIRAQSNFAPALKTATNPHFKSKYVALDGVIDAVAAPLREQGIAIMQMTDIEDARTVLVTRLIHESGEWLGSRYPVHPVKADPQGEGSALTYARRYALMALVGIAPEDDDGNAAVKAISQRQPTGKVLPTDGAWDAMPPEVQERLLKVAAEIADHMETGDAAGAVEYIERQGFDSDTKIALWTRLDSSTRSALKKASTQRKAA